jgi:hypothetical protein
MSTLALTATFSLSACAAALAGFAEPTTNLAREDMARMARQSARQHSAYPIPTQERIRSLSDAGTLSSMKYNMLVTAIDVVDVANSVLSGIEIMGGKPEPVASVSEALCKSFYKLGAKESAVSFGPASLRDQIVTRECLKGLRGVRIDDVELNVGAIH